MASVKMLLMIIMTGTSLVLSVLCDESVNNEPTCYTKYDCDYKLMQKVIELDQTQKVLSEQLYQQSKVIGDLQQELQDSVQTQWREWTTWSKCTFSCTGQDGGRLQTRDRTRSTTSGDTQSETESRPCNAVQFAGCVNQHGADDNFAVVYDAADQVALSTCTAINEPGRYVYAIRRQCSSLAVPCDELCETLDLTCFNALHLYRAAAMARDDVGTKGYYTFRYNSCANKGCGPNFCCCKNKRT